MHISKSYGSYQKLCLRKYCQKLPTNMALLKRKGHCWEFLSPIYCHLGILWFVFIREYLRLAICFFISMQLILCNMKWLGVLRQQRQKERRGCNQSTQEPLAFHLGWMESHIFLCEIMHSLPFKRKLKRGGKKKLHGIFVNASCNPLSSLYFWLVLFFDLGNCVS